jgi:hypothetical protein
MNPGRIIKMTKEEIIDGLESLKQNSEDFARAEERDGDYDTIWHHDMAVIDAAIRIINGVGNEI